MTEHPRSGVRDSQRRPVLSPQCSVPGTKYQSLLAPIRSFLAATLLLLALGCRPTGQGTDVEPSFDHQLRLVNEGRSDLIHVASFPVSDEQLAQLTTARSLRVLLLDFGEGHITAAGLKHLTSLPNLQHFRCRSPRINDAALGELAKIKSLKILNLPYAEFSDAGLALLRDLPELVQLRFHSPHVSDTGIQSLTDFPTLSRLHLIDVALTDTGLEALTKLEKLESLYIDGSQFSDAAVDVLFAKRPDLHVHFNQTHHDRDPNKDLP